MEHIKELLAKGKTSEAIALINRTMENETPSDEMFYLRGNAFCKEHNWQRAMESYLEALNLNANSPAGEALKMVQNILEFYNKEIYCQ